MKTFIERLKDLGVALLLFIVMSVIVSIPLGLLFLLDFIHKDLPEIIILILMAGFIIFGIGKFIYWLFIEPFMITRKSKKKE